jgi:hypothetical protein
MNTPINTKLCTLITSLYKSEGYLEKFLQNMEKFEEEISKINPNFSREYLIISNDPTEKEKFLLENIEDKMNKVRVIFVPLETLYATWNRGVSEAKGEVIGFWNVDDIRYPKAIVDGVSLLKGEYDLVYFPFRYKRYIRIFGLDILVKNKIVQVPQFDQNEFIRSMVCGPFFIFKKSLFEKVGPFDEQFKIAGDFDWCVRAAKISKFIKSEEVAGLFMNNGTSLSGSKNKLQGEENNTIYKKHGVFDKIK